MQIGRNFDKNPLCFKEKTRPGLPCRVEVALGRSAKIETADTFERCRLAEKFGHPAIEAIEPERREAEADAPRHPHKGAPGDAMCNIAGHSCPQNAGEAGKEENEGRHLAKGRV